LIINDLRLFGIFSLISWDVDRVPKSYLLSKRHPVKTKTYSKQITLHDCVIRQRGDAFQVEFNHDGKRERKTWPTLAAAKVYAKQKSIEVMNEGSAAFELSTKQRQDAAEAFKRFPNGSLETAIREYVEATERLQEIPLKNAIDFYLQHHKPEGGVRTFTALMQEYLASKEKSGCRKASISDIKSRSDRKQSSRKNRH